ncbi:hypothetical protein GCM10027570_10430 [Streptomonospora sediminis]
MPHSCKWPDCALNRAEQWRPRANATTAAAEAQRAWTITGTATLGSPQRDSDANTGQDDYHRPHRRRVPPTTAPRSGMAANPMARCRRWGNGAKPVARPATPPA